MEISLESKAMTILETYEGGNNYLLELKRKSQINKKFYPTRSQSDYIINYENVKPKVARKWVDLDTYFAKKFSEERYLLNVPEKIYDLINRLFISRLLVSRLNQGPPHSTNTL